MGFSLFSMVEPLIGLMVSCIGWLIVGGLGASLWHRDLKLPGGMLLGVAAGGILVRCLGFLLSLGWRFLLPETYATLDGGLLTTDRVVALLQTGSFAVSILALLVNAVLAAAIFVGRDPVDGAPPDPTAAAGR
ncbi:MAG: hypothetical protein H6742_13510 [Alphaproteobacteria bacterium]|nr:hypothetical protein [Alphaproteobacteria bacterium]